MPKEPGELGEKNYDTEFPESFPKEAYKEFEKEKRLYGTVVEIRHLPEDEDGIPNSKSSDSMDLVVHIEGVGNRRVIIPAHRHPSFIPEVGDKIELYDYAVGKGGGENVLITTLDKDNREIEKEK